MSHIRLEVIDQTAKLAPFMEFWSRHAPSPMQSPEWLQAWWASHGSSRTQLCVVVVRTADHQTIGLAPFYMRDNWTEGRSIRFLGSGRACGDFQTLLSAPEHAAAVGKAIGDWLLANQSELNWSLLELEGVTDNDPAIGALASRLRRGRCSQYEVDLESTWRLDVTKGWAGFHEGMSKTQRRQTRNLVNRFDKNNDLQVRFVQEPAELHWALSVCVDLHQRRWQAAEEPGCFADSRFHRFIEFACAEMAAQNAISFAVLEDRGVPIACHFYLNDAAGNKYMYQSGRDPAREAEGVGRILNAIAVREACEAGIQFIDFLRGDETYKSRLGATPTRCLRLRLVPPTLLPRLRHGLRTITRQVKHKVERLRKSWNQPESTPAEMVEQSNSPIDTDA